eukprot:c16367_g1_i1.p1 GENE.c16367_g1_i1~~c16367_g1_i1.p1  ORF type:complete len:163 (+),score=31.65 c16367_g1_i1:212-700(+)
MFGPAAPPLPTVVPAVPSYPANVVDPVELMKTAANNQQYHEYLLNKGHLAAAAATGAMKQKRHNETVKEKKKFTRTAAGLKWDDETLREWPENDYRIFVGDLGNECSDDTLAKAFSKYSSFAKARVVRDKRTGESRGYGFVSLLDPEEFVTAMREMNGMCGA